METKLRSNPVTRGKSRARTSLTSPDALVSASLVPPERREDAERVARRYAIAVTPAMASLIDPGNGEDPIARQFLPDPSELDISAAESADPIGDDAHSPVEGLVHRYPDRVLIKLVSVCPVYCRFCFRRETVGKKGEALLSASAFEAARAYVAARPAIWEVIFSGGDPLILSPRRLRSAVEAFGPISHVNVMRWHTRVPVVAPERITPALIRALKSAGKAIYVALHANHPRELTPQARAACARLIDAGIPMLSQTVLLKGVNDDEETLASLMRAFVAARIKPYYLHHLDRAPGTAHFAVAIERGQELMRALRGQVSGLCLPSYVLDIPGGHGKSPIGPTYLETDGDGQSRATRRAIRDFRGRFHPIGGACR
ncbi:MAG: lysine-2,3-aminomutase-like protein [Hyphomicrobiales bacterium]|nr:lysine-2,3-aminomutase-like protein [Hyphomicrobiales bacterium]